MINIILNKEEDGHEDLTGEEITLNQNKTIHKCISSQNHGDQFTLENGWILDFIYNDSEEDTITGHWELTK